MLKIKISTNISPKSIHFYGWTFLCLAFTLLGCSPNNPTQASPSSKQPNVESVAESVAEPIVKPTIAVTQDRRTIQHAMGTTEIIGTPQRVVVLTNEGTDMLLALGVTPIGAVKSWQGEPYSDYLKDQLEDVPMVGDEFQPNLERIVSLQPDLIIGSKVRQEQVYPKLAAIAPTVFSETLGVTWKDNLQLYAKALNKEAKAKALLTEWDDRVASFKAQLGDRSPTVSLVRFMPGTVKIYYQQSFPGQIVAEVGLLRPSSQQKDGFAEEISLESIAKIEADYLFYFTYNQGDQNNQGEDFKNQWFDNPLWQKLAVVQNHKIYEVSDAEWTSSSGILAAHQVLNDLSMYILKEEQDPGL
jgi:iron complex transport system substrate-binding protein